MSDYERSVVAEWNELALTAVRESGARPTPTAYQLFVTHAAVYDAWSAYDEDATGLYSTVSRPRVEHTEDNKVEAVSYAAYRALTELFPDQTPIFDEFMDVLELDIHVDTTDPSTPAGVGNAAAAGVFAGRAGDGSDRENDFSDTAGYVARNSADPDADNAPGGDDFDPNHWQPLRVPNGEAVDENGTPIATDDPSTYDDQVILTPYWGSVTPFGLPSGDYARPAAPPQLGDHSRYVDGRGDVTTGNQAYLDQFNEVLSVSAELTVEQKVIAEFWADGPRTESPPGHWNQFAQDIAKRDDHGVDDDAKMFFALNGAILDASIATWEAKNHYDFIRPQSAIRDLYFDEHIEAWGGPNLGTQMILGQEWRPYQDTTFVTPPFQEYTSGHSAFSAAAAEVLERYSGTDSFYDGVTRGNFDLDGDGELDLLGEFVATGLSFEDYDGLPVVLQWETLGDAADEAGVSRIFGGIHIQDGDLRGREIGETVADLAYARAEALFNGDASASAAQEEIKVGLYDVSTDDFIQFIQDGDTVDISQLEPGLLTLAIAAEVSGVDRVALDLNDGAVQRVEAVAPYALFGDVNGDFFQGSGLHLGENNLAVSLIGGDRERSESAIDITFDLVDRSSTPIASDERGVTFGLYDARTDEKITDLVDGGVIDRRLVEGRSVTLLVEASDDLTFDFYDISEVRLDLNDGAATAVEFFAPYALFGDDDGDLFGGTLDLGENQISYEVFDRSGLVADGTFDFLIV